MRLTCLDLRFQPPRFRPASAAPGRFASSPLLALGQPRPRAQLRPLRVLSGCSKDRLVTLNTARKSGRNRQLFPAPVGPKDQLGKEAEIRYSERQSAATGLGPPFVTPYGPQSEPTAN